MATTAAGSSTNRLSVWVIVGLSCFWALVGLTTIASLPLFVQQCGWGWVAACAFWSLALAGALMFNVFGRIVRPNLRTHHVIDKRTILFDVSSFLAAYFLMIVGPPIATAMRSGFEAAMASFLLSFLVGTGALGIWSIPHARKKREESLETDRLYARFSDGPVGVWRSVSDEQIETTCRIIFFATGDGVYWESRDEALRATSVATRFGWRSAGESPPYRLIDVRIVDDESWTHLSYVIAPYSSGPRLFIVTPGILESYKGDSLEELEGVRRAFWPGHYLFGYVGEPSERDGSMDSVA